MSLFSLSEQSEYLLIRFLAADSANAFSLAAGKELASITKKYKDWKKPVVVTSGHARVFCSGGNLTDYKKLKTKAEGLKVNREITKCLDSFASWPVVKLAVVNGDVLGGGMEWLARFDFRWSTPNAIFAFWQRRIGLSPGWGGGKWWSQKIGEENLRKILVEAAPLTALEAKKLNLVDRILPHWRVDDELRAFSADKSLRSTLSANTWSSNKESKIFSDLWLAKEHSKILKNWK